MKKVKNDSLKKIIIVGGGISGLSSGIYGQKHGFITEIYEKNPVAGGLCTSWTRKGLTVDGCIHWLTGTREGTEINYMWKDVGAFSQEDIIEPDNFGTIICEGIPITLWCDLNKLEQELIEISPEDKKLIKKTNRLILAFQNLHLPIDIPLSEMSLWKLMKVGISLLPYLNVYFYASKKGNYKYSLKFKSPAIRYLINHVVPGDGNLYTSLYAFGTVSVGNGGVPKGGSRTIINNMVREYERVGGKIHYAKEVDEIVIKDGIAKGIKLKDGTIIEADYVVAACDSMETISHLLKNKYIIKGFEKRKKLQKDYPTQSCALVTFSVDEKKYRELGITSTYEFPVEPFEAGTSFIQSLRTRVYNYDPSFIVDGKTILNTLIFQSDKDYEYWDQLNKTKPVYNYEKEKLALEVQKRIIEKFPTLKDSLEIIDIVTPKTFNRYTNAYHGAYMPFAFTSTGSMFYYDGKIKGVKNVLVSGQWTLMPGGLPIALMTGKWAIQRILNKEHKWFAFTKPIKFNYTK